MIILTLACHNTIIFKWLNIGEWNHVYLWRFGKQFYGIYICIPHRNTVGKITSSTVQYQTGKKTRSRIFRIALAQIFKKKIALIFDMISCEKEEVRNLKKTEGKYHKSCENLFCHCMPMCITQIGSTQNYCVSQDEEDHV